MSLYAVLTAALWATAVAAKNSFKDTRANDVGGAKKILIGGGPSGTIAAADFDGKTFDIVVNNTIPGTSASWLLFKEPNLLYAVDENSATTRLFNVRDYLPRPPRRHPPPLTFPASLTPTPMT